MNYEEKYNAALQRARALNNGEDIDVEAGTTTCEYIFPELKESRDEKIKREILELVSIAGNGNQFEEIKDWLEKQKNTQDKEYVFRPFAGEAIEKAAERAVELDGKVVLAFNGAYIPIGNKTKDEIVAEYNSWLEKQGEKDPCIGCTNDKGCVACVDGNMKETKIEPKFHPGDWITHNTANFVFKIINVSSNGYVVVNRENYKKTISFDNEGNYRLWTIEDAKDGDVLVASDGSIFLFAGVDDCACKYYVALTTDNCLKINKEVKGGYWETSRAVYPATKEQRDLFFSKMKEAGWQWDAEKKEANKIEVVSKESEDEQIKRELRNDLLLYVPTPERYISWIEKQGHMLDTDKVIEWLECKAFQGWAEPIDIRPIIRKFKKDFGL